ncbi:hypothetical protein [Streptomyces sp. NPDC003720]|uniref:hypothetical protein n=1 Tax=Streptomyces sp. NPDC003720 TaxID=3364684 RepID=UPI0036CC874D
MPSEDIVPPGPARDVLSELHKLYLLAGTPGLREISTGIADREDFSSTLNRNLISRILTGKTAANALQLDSLVRFFAERAVNRLNPDEESDRLLALWMDANGAPQRKSDLSGQGGDSVELALREASSQGTAEPLVKMCTNADPSIVLRVLDEIGRRKWSAFLQDVKKSLCVTFAPPNVPTLVAEMRLYGHYGWDALRVLEGFGRARSVSEVAELMRLLCVAGSTEDAASVLHAFLRVRKTHDAANLYGALLEVDVAPWELREPFSGNTPFVSDFVEFASLLDEMGRSGAVVEAISHRIRVAFGRSAPPVALRTCVHLLDAGMVNHAEDLMVLTLVRGVERDLSEYLANESVSREEKDAVLDLSKHETVKGRVQIILEAKDIALRRQFGVVRE